MMKFLICFRVSGWGTLAFQGPQSDRLMAVDVPVVSDEGAHVSSHANKMYSCRPPLVSTGFTLYRVILVIQSSYLSRDLVGLTLV